MTIRGFEFIEEGSFKTTAAEVHDDAMHLLNTLTTDNPHGLSYDGFMFGMEGRRASVDASRAILTFLAKTAVISINDANGCIEYPPVKP